MIKLMITPIPMSLLVLCPLKGVFNFFSKGYPDRVEGQARRVPAALVLESPYVQSLESRGKGCVHLISWDTVPLFQRVEKIAERGDHLVQPFISSCLYLQLV